MRGGGALTDIRPLNPEGNVTEGILGCHRGDFEYLNIENPQPGFKYRHERRKEGNIRRRTREGWEVVTEHHPERLAGEFRNPNFAAAGLDSATVTGDVVLMRVPLDHYSTRRHDRDQIPAEQLRGAAEGTEFTGRQDTIPGVENYARDDRPVYYRLGDHRITHSEK